MPFCDCSELVGLLTAQLFHWPIYFWGLAPLVVREGTVSRRPSVFRPNPSWKRSSNEAFHFMFICSWAQGISGSPQETEGLLPLSSPPIGDWSPRDSPGSQWALGEFAEVPWNAEMGGEATVKAQLLVPTSRYLEFKVLPRPNSCSGGSNYARCQVPA